jgi:hypothetical protein
MWYLFARKKPFITNAKFYVRNSDHRSKSESTSKRFAWLEYFTQGKLQNCKTPLDYMYSNQMIGK